MLPRDIAHMAQGLRPPSLSSSDPEAVLDFQALLDPTAAVARIEKQPTVSFDHLGMFGLHHGQSYTDEPDTDIPAPEPIEAPEQPADRDRTLVAGGAIAPGEQPSPDVARAPETSKIAISPGRDTAVAGNNSQPMPLLAVGRISMPADPEPPLGRIRSAAPNPLPCRPPSTARESLVIGGDGNLLSLAVRSGNGGGEDGSRLRRRMQAVAAEFGVDISDFHLDGASIGSLVSRQEA